jgi:hypothetical protein
MPYIKQEDRKKFDDAFNNLHCPESAGELNYMFTKICLRYFEKHHNYQGINDIIGALHGAASEFTRRYVAPYEDTKIKENQDVNA